MRGTLGVNGANCFTLDDMVIVADRGSRVLADGSGISLSDGASIKVGDEIQAGGGQVHDMRASRGIEGWKDCLEDGSETTTFALIHPVTP